MIRILGLLVVLHVSPGVWGQTTMPAWFWQPEGPRWSEVFAASDEQALDAAAQVQTAYERSDVLGKFQQFYDENFDDRTWQNTDYDYQFSQERVAARRGELEVKDWYTVNVLLRQRVYLVGPKGELEPASYRLISPERLVKPEWSDVLTDRKDGRLRATGQFTLDGNDADAWVKTEELAVFQLLRSKQIQLGQVKKLTDDGAESRLTSIEWINVRFRLADLKVEGRWVDLQNNVAVVMVSAPIDSIRSIE